MDRNSFINSLVHHFTDSDTEAQSDSNDLGARFLALGLQAAPGQAGHLRQLSGRVRKEWKPPALGPYPSPLTLIPVGEHLPARNSTFISSESHLQGPILPSALWATRCQAGPCSLHGKSTAGSEFYSLFWKGQATRAPRSPGGWASGACLPSGCVRNTTRGP